jgi:hypothetical protein
MKNTNKISYSLFALAGICAVVAVVLLTSTAVAHAQYDYSYDYGPSYDYSYDSGSYYDYSYDSAPSYDYSYDTGSSYGYSYDVAPIYSYGYSSPSVYSGVSYSYSSPSVTYVSPRTVAYYPTPTYNYSNTYYPPAPSIVSPLTATCYPSGSSVYAGDSMTWLTSISGGETSYNVTWSGDEGLSGHGTSISKVYNYAGTKTASIRVISGTQSITANCSSAYVNERPGYNYNYNYNYNQYPSYNNYSPVSVSCVANTNSAAIGTIVTWTAAVSGGNGYYTYSWSGTDGLYGSSQSVSRSYSNLGLKTAYVTVTSNGYTNSATCSNSVNIGQVGYIINPINTNSLDVGCFVDPNAININQPVTWSAEVTGGIRPYTYSWTGSDGLTGTDKSVIKTYSTTGEKNAIVTVRSADGKTGTRSCTNTLAVRGGGSSVATNGTTGTTAKVTGSKTVTTVTTETFPGTSVATTNGTEDGNQLSAATVFSFNNVPWGWIAILIILVLFATVMYLLFNRQKI